MDKPDPRPPRRSSVARLHALAHELNNALAIVQGYAAVACRKAERGEPVDEELHLVQQAAARMGQQVQALQRQLGRPPLPVPARTELTDAGRGERVVVAEDEPALRRMMVRVLNEAGYEAVGARDGQTALEKIQASPRPVHLLITDAVMPRLDGAALVDRVLDADPTLPVLVVSGGPPPGAPPGARVRHLAKPFPVEALLQCVRATLDEAGSWQSPPRPPQQ